jgi:hypothetical protein
MAEDSPPVDYSPPANPPIIQETPATEVPHFITHKPQHHKNRIKLFLPLIILAAFLPIATGAVLLRQSLSGEAALSILGCRVKPASVRIHPGQVQTTIGSPPVSFSALAYDKEGRPIWSGVTYEWGMSSTASIGNLIPSGNLATFIAQNPGQGDVFAVAKYCNKKATGSSLVIVLSRPIPTPLPTIILTPTPTRAPTPTRPPGPTPSIFPTSTRTPNITPTPLFPG